MASWVIYCCLLYLAEYDTLSRLGISDPQSFVKKRFKADAVEYLSSCCVGQLIRDQVESEVDEVISSKTWLDIMVHCHMFLIVIVLLYCNQMMLYLSTRCRPKLQDYRYGPSTLYNVAVYLPQLQLSPVPRYTAKWKMHRYTRLPVHVCERLCCVKWNGWGILMSYWLEVRWQLTSKITSLLLPLVTQSIHVHKRFHMWYTLMFAHLYSHTKVGTPPHSSLAATVLK